MVLPPLAENSQGQFFIARFLFEVEAWESLSRRDDRLITKYEYTINQMLSGWRRAGGPRAG